MRERECEKEHEDKVKPHDISRTCVHVNAICTQARVRWMLENERRGGEQDVRGPTRGSVDSSVLTQFM